MRAFMIGVVVCLAISEVGTAQLPAQKGTPGKGTRPTEAPKDKTTVAEPEKTAKTKLTPKAGGQPKTVVAIDSIDYLIGIRGYPAGDGIVVMSTVQRKDLDQASKVRCPAAEIEVDFQGNGRTVRVRLEAGDKITAVGGYEVKTPDELAVAVNSASDPHVLEISFIDWRTGNEYTGTINAMKVK